MTCFADPAVEGGHALRQQHTATCTEPGCPGCLPCRYDTDGTPLRHCGTCRTAKHHHLDPGRHVCGHCVTKLRASLQDLLDAYALLPYEALADGITSEAFVHAGPRANAADLNRSLVAARSAGYGDSDLGDDDTDPWQPIADAERLLRGWAGHNTYLEVSGGIPGTIRYLQDLLPTLARHPDGPDLVVDLRGRASSTRGRLEAVLHNSRGPEKGAPCPACAETLGIDPADPDAKRAPRLELHRVDHDRTGASDTWRCPTHPHGPDAHVWTAAAYRHRIGTDYRAHATWLTATDMAAEHDVKTGTLKSWASRGQVASKKRDGRTVYSVADVKAQRQAATA